MHLRIRRWLAAALVLLLTVWLPPVQAAGQTQAGERLVYGYSGLNRELEAWRFGSGPNVLVMCFAIHGYEDAFDRDGECLVEGANALMHHLSGATTAGLGLWTVYILPCMNPDGLYSGHTENGPGRCTTTWLLPDGTLNYGRGVDLNRCFPTDFKPLNHTRNFTGEAPMAAREARALDRFLQTVKGTELNVLVDVHGWYQEIISHSEWLLTVLQSRFPENRLSRKVAGTGYLITYAESLGYQTALLELSAEIDSMEAYRSSDINERLIRSLESILVWGAINSAERNEPSSGKPVL